MQRILRALIVATGAAAMIVASGSAAGAEPRSPGRFTGQAFDTCVSPSDEVMDAWNVASPFAVVGIYTSGNSRYCDDDKQPHLSPAWVKRQAAKGWRFLPIHVGYQAPCFASDSKKKMSYDLPTARVQARADATEATSRAAWFGFARGNAVYLDIEYYDRSRTACNEAVLAFVSAFTKRAHDRGYRVGLYSSASAAVQAVDIARLAGRDLNYPDQMWFAWTNRVANLDGRPYLSASGWAGNRIHQFHNNVEMRFGGRTVLIDRNVLQVGGGSRATKPRSLCRVALNQTSYRRVGPGSKGDQTRLLQCLLRKAGLNAKATGRWNRSTARSVRALHVRLGRAATTKVSRVTWTALLSRGATAPVLKQGHTGERVWRLQRSLRAAGQQVVVNGVFDQRTTKAVKAYLARVGLPAYPTADTAVWVSLQRGRR